MPAPSAASEMRKKKFALVLFLNLFLVVTVALSCLFIYLFTKPFRRGFYCDDDTIAKPYHESTVRQGMFQI
jgi:hypothetical protein